MSDPYQLGSAHVQVVAVSVRPADHFADLVGTHFYAFPAIIFAIFYCVPCVLKHRWPSATRIMMRRNKRRATETRKRNYFSEQKHTSNASRKPVYIYDI